MLRHPTTQVTVAEARDAEAPLDVAAMVREKRQASTVQEFTFPQERTQNAEPGPLADEQNAPVCVLRKNMRRSSRRISL